MTIELVSDNKFSTSALGGVHAAEESAPNGRSPREGVGPRRGGTAAWAFYIFDCHLL
jgi:hypothetical protein